MNLTKNVGTLDRFLRIASGITLVVLAVAGIPGAPLAWVTVSVAVILLATGATGFCPLYAILGLSTRTARA